MCHFHLHIIGQNLGDIPKYKGGYEMFGMAKCLAKTRRSSPIKDRKKKLLRGGSRHIA